TPQTVHSEGQFDLGFSTPNLKIVASGFGANEPTNAYKMNGGIGGLISGQTDAGSAGASVRTIISKTGNGTPLDKKTDGSFFVNVSVPALVPVLAEAVPDLKLSVGTRSDYFSSEYNLFGQINNLSSTFATTFSASYPVFGRLLSANASLNPNLTRIEVNYETGASLELFGGYTHAVGLDASGAQVTTNIVGGGIRFVY
ncbi:MAG: hypothetical protein KGH63_04325, partial [Candidatus Micrarchaeota archaeon]|nr:hypothetical protein [Candidatus Micrarchaeota archaeon]